MQLLIEVAGTEAGPSLVLDKSKEFMMLARKFKEQQKYLDTALKLNVELQVQVRDLQAAKEKLVPEQNVRLIELAAVLGELNA